MFSPANAPLFSHFNIMKSTQLRTHCFPPPSYLILMILIQIPAFLKKLYTHLLSWGCAFGNCCCSYYQSEILLNPCLTCMGQSARVHNGRECTRGLGLLGSCQSNPTVQVYSTQWPLLYHIFSLVK